MRKFTRKELAFYNGKYRRPAYVGYKGKIYDLSSSFLWRNGQHQVLHNAGLDLTANISQAPHGAEFLFKFPVIGSIAKIAKSKARPKSF